MFDAPVTFQQAADRLSSRMDRPTAMKYQAIVSTWDANARRHAFFSSRVAEGGILGELHRRAQAVVEGRMSQDQARRLLREYFVGEGADPLAALGFAPPKDAKGVAQLASIPRLELILDTNVRMAQETGHWQKWRRMSKAYPYGVWRVGVCDNHRKSHLERDGKVYAFDHPIWTQSPPGGEFHCHCRRELATAEDLEDMGVKPEPNDSSFEPSSLGFDPSADDFPEPPVGKRVPDPIAKKAEQKMKEDAEFLETSKDVYYENVSSPFAPVQDETREQAVERIKKASQETVLNLQEIFSIENNELPELSLLPESAEKTKDGLIRLGQYISSKNLVEISAKAPYPILTSTHEYIHAIIEKGLIMKKAFEPVVEAVKITRTYTNGIKILGKHYKEEYAKEMAVRSLAWFALSHGKSQNIRREFLAFWENKYNLITQNMDTHAWPGFNNRKRSDLYDIELEEIIMKKISNPSWLVKFLRKIGFADLTEDKKTDLDLLFEKLAAKEGLTVDEWYARAKKSPLPNPMPVEEVYD